jgi:hypothetical protein
MKASLVLFFIISLCAVSPSQAQERKDVFSSVLRKYVIERDIANAGKLSEQELRNVATQSCTTMKKMTQNVQWVQSYVTDNKVYCVYLAENEEVIREHAKLAGFPANKISEVKTTIDPTFALK